MAQFNLTIDTDNAAFEGDWSGEVVRIMRDLADRMERNTIGSKFVRDVNGNTVGCWAHDTDMSRTPQCKQLAA